MVKDNQKTSQIFYYLKQNLCFIFSFDGIVTRSQFAIFLIFINAIFFQCSPIWSYITGLVSFYCILALVQKRCRDFNSGGTFWIILISLGFVVGKACHFIDTTTEFLQDVYKYTLNFELVVFLPLFFIPSKANPDLELRSPLLKYPLLYTAVCWFLAISATLTISHYAGIGINLL